MPLLTHSSAATRFFVNAIAALKPLLRPMLAMWLLLLLSRWALSFWQSERVLEADGWRHVLLEGLRFDGVLLGLFWVLPAALTPWMAMSQRGAGIWAQGLRFWGLVGIVALAFMELSTPAFILQYDSRPNYLFVEYIGYAKEVGGTLLKDFWPHLLATAVLLPATGWLYWRFTSTGIPVRRLSVWQALPLSLLVFVALALCGRGALGHRPANPATAAVTPDHLVNELPLSSAYTVMYAMHLARKGDEGGITYGKMPREQVIDLVRKASGVPDSHFTDPTLPLSHTHIAPHPRERPLNLVIVLEESLGAEFVGRLGGLPLTPNLDRLADEGIWFERLYATGTRSVRGIEAVVAGYPPTSAVSTVKLAKSQRDFFTIASLLKTQGYESTFFYGGESHFDNMRSFFMGNGFDRVIEQKDMPADAFVATWGASDGDVLKRAHEHFVAQPSDKPFFGLIFTSSNHSPFEFPEGQIEPYEQPLNTVNNAVKYADHALGQFIAMARSAPYWDNTVFLVVADHNSRVYGPSLLPVERFHIPGLILGGTVQKGQRLSTVASQIDLPPTLFSLMGLSGTTPLIGRDLTHPVEQQKAGRAIMQFDKIQAYMEGAEVVLLQPELAPRVMRFDGRQLQPADQNAPELIDKAIAHSLYAQMAYRDRLHR